MLAHDCRDAFSGQGAKREEGPPAHPSASTRQNPARAGTRVEEGGRSQHRRWLVCRPCVGEGRATLERDRRQGMAASGRTVARCRCATMRLNVPVLAPGMDARRAETAGTSRNCRVGLGARQPAPHCAAYFHPAGAGGAQASLPSLLAKRTSPFPRRSFHDDPRTYPQTLMRVIDVIVPSVGAPEGAVPSVRLTEFTLTSAL